MKLNYDVMLGTDRGSLPVRGAWIEIADKRRIENRKRVAPRKGSVD